MNIDDIVTGFNTTPFIFAGSGLTRRYLDLPDWEGLLNIFAKKIRDDDFVYRSYVNKAESMENNEGVMPKVAELIQKDFDEKWFSDATIRSLNSNYLEMVKNGVSPFKAEIAMFIKSSNIINQSYVKEVEELSQISKKSISGIITTNYDMFFEGICDGYTKYIGQEELIFSAIQGIAEIYKIHGSVEKPDSIIINEKDYHQFNEKSSYLAAKLMTIFMEYPIMFIGYSISDSNIQKILKAIVGCLDENKLRKLSDRFIFVEYEKDFSGVEITPYTIMIDDKPLEMKKIKLSDFSLIYKSLASKKAKLPAKILRRFKEELYNFTITNVPTANLRVAALDDSRVDDDELVMAIGKVTDFGLKGLKGLESNEWYRSILLDDLEFSADELLEFAFPVLNNQNSAKLPLNKYLKMANKEFPECRATASQNQFDALISNTIKKNRKPLGDYKSVDEIWKREKDNLEKGTRLIAYLPEAQIDIEQLEFVLKELFEDNINILIDSKPNIRSNIRRLILMYDYLKWGK
ncbi:MAG: SIR2 family protein [Mobilitalea sp.]